MDKSFDMILAPRVKMDKVSGKLAETNEPLLASYEEQERPAHLLIEALNNQPSHVIMKASPGTVTL